MNTHKLRLFTPISFSLALSVLTVLLATAQASAQCTQVISGLREPLGTALSNQGNLLVSETGTSAPNSGRISILDASGNRRTLLDGLPSAINDVNEPSGPAGLFMRGRILYVAIGVGDVGRPDRLRGPRYQTPLGLRRRFLARFWPSSSASTRRTSQPGSRLRSLTSRLLRVARM